MADSQQRYRAALTSLLHAECEITRVSSVGGGCISDATCVDAVIDGKSQRLFVKSNSADFLENFRAEWDGLERLHRSETITVPSPLGVGEHGGLSYLVLGWVEPGRQASGFYPEFGRRLAAMHRATVGDRIGLEYDNFLGSAHQKNEPREDWPTFFAEQRIEFQLKWAVDQGLARAELRRDVSRIVEAMPQLLEGRKPETSLLHGDLWSGNYLCNSDGEPVVIDPAVYYGCREAEFGMLRLFGGCPSEFYDAYLQAWPLTAGWQRRCSVYVLYHLLNHLNLFGSGYHGQCEAVAAEILRQ